MFYFQFEARPDPTHEDAADLGGAFVNCWVATEVSRSEAEAIARGGMTDEGWCPFELVESSVVERSDYDDNHSGLVHYQRALDEGLAMIIHTYPIDDGAGATGVPSDRRSAGR